MKHNTRLNLILLVIFIFAQIIGLFIVSQYIDIKTTSETGKTEVHENKYLIEPPEVENESNTWISLFLAILIGTGLLLLLIKFRLFAVWKGWFTISIFIALFIALYPFTGVFFKYGWIITLTLVSFLTYKKLKSDNPLWANLTEIFIYGGIAALFVPIINMTSAIILLLLISVYDMYAVWKSKHMVKLADFQSKQNLFAGINIFYKKNKDNVKFVSSNKGNKSVKKAIIGGGDITFPLLFSGAVLKMTGSFFVPIIIVILAALSLFLLLEFGKPNKYYPAMPFISAGCFLGYFIPLIFLYIQAFLF
ncbi:MAG: presenilin family intramembrane aspartyl protease [Nanobdellota archaeon]